MHSDHEERVLVIAPVGKDASIAGDVLQKAGIAAEACAGPTDLGKALVSGAGCLLLTQEALSPALAEWLLDALDIHSRPGRISLLSCW